MQRLSIANPEFAWDPEDPPGFHNGMARFGPDAGARQTGVSVYELPPGQALCPYHYEYGVEEWLLVLAGHPTVRAPEATQRLDPDDLVFFPAGPEGAHQVRNDGDEAVRVLMWSNVVYPSAAVYPDSDKIGIFTSDAAADDVMVRRSSAVGYYDGEA